MNLRHQTFYLGHIVFMIIIFSTFSCNQLETPSQNTRSKNISDSNQSTDKSLALQELDGFSSCVPDGFETWRCEMADGTTTSVAVNWCDSCGPSCSVDDGDTGTDIFSDVDVNVDVEETYSSEETYSEYSTDTTYAEENYTDNSMDAPSEGEDVMTSYQTDNEIYSSFALTTADSCSLQARQARGQREYQTIQGFFRNSCLPTNFSETPCSTLYSTWWSIKLANAECAVKARQCSHCAYYDYLKKKYEKIKTDICNSNKPFVPPVQLKPITKLQYCQMADLTLFYVGKRREALSCK